MFGGGRSGAQDEEPLTQQSLDSLSRMLRSREATHRQATSSNHFRESLCEKLCIPECEADSTSGDRIRTACGITDEGEPVGQGQRCEATA